MPRSLASLCASVCSLILIACSNGNIDTAEPSEESDTPVEIESSTDFSTNTDNGSTSASESAQVNVGEIDSSTSGSNGSTKDSESASEGIARNDNVNYLVESLPLVDSQLFAECFIDTFAAETGLAYYDLFPYLDFVIVNGASEENLGLEYFLAVNASLTACDGFLSQDDVQRVAEIIEETESEYEALPILVGDEQAGIFYYVENPDPEWGEIYFETVGNGPIKVIMSDIFGYETSETHGHRVKDTFLTFAQNDNFTLFTTDGGSGTSFEAIHTNVPVIISASAHLVTDPFEIGDVYYLEVENLKATNALYLSSLENAGIHGDPELGVYPYPHAGNAYVIENDPDAMKQTIFIAWYHDFAEEWGSESSVDTRRGAVDLHGGFVQRNLEDIVFVQIPTDYPSSDTSHATPIAASWAVDVVAQNPNASAEELKQLLLAETISVDVTVEDLYYDEAAGSLSDESAYISYSEIMTVNILPAL